MSIVRIPPTLRDEAGGERQVLAEGGTVREVLDDLAERYPALAARILDNGGIAPFVNVYVEGEDVRTREGLDTPVGRRLDGDPAAGHGRRLTTPVQKLYEVWAGDSELREALGREPRPARDGLAVRGVRGARPAAGRPRPRRRRARRHARDPARARARRSGGRARSAAAALWLARERVAEAGLTDEIDVVEGAIEELPFEDASFDWIWCRDVLVHVDARARPRGVRARPQAGRRAARVRDARDRPARAAKRPSELVRRAGIATASTPTASRAAALPALRLRRAIGRAARLRVARADDRGRRVGRPAGPARARAPAPPRSRARRAIRRRRRRRRGRGLAWGVYQLLGKLCPTVYVWERRA